MKKAAALLGIMILLLSAAGCAPAAPQADIAATTLPVYDLTSRLCSGTGLTVTRLVTEQVSCLHDYSLQVRQVKALEGAKAVVLSGAGLEDFMTDALKGARCVIDASRGLTLLTGDAHEHGQSHEHEEGDPHIWLCPAYAGDMARNICARLSEQFPGHAAAFQNNLETLLEDLAELQRYGETQLADLSCRELVTFHDGFGYFAHAFGLTILEAVEEESGSEASAAELKRLIELTRGHSLPAVFTERSGSTSAAGILHAETGVAVFDLDMAMAGDSYFDAMYHNIDTIREALG